MNKLKEIERSGATIAFQANTTQGVTDLFFDIDGNYFEKEVAHIPEGLFEELLNSIESLQSVFDKINNLS